MTGPDHYRLAEELTEQANVVMDADYGWMGGLSGEERLLRRGACLAEAQVHATLALAAATALGHEGSDGTQPVKDRAAWFDVAAECKKAAQS